MSILQRAVRQRKPRSTSRFQLLLGPAGSGKTQAVAERVLRLVRAHRRVLAILPTETARARVEEHVYDGLPLGRGLAGLELHTPLSLNGLIANDFGHLRGRWRSRTVLHSLASQAAFLHANINHLPLDRLRPKQGLHDAMLSLASFFSRVQDVGITAHEYLDLVQHHLPHWTEEARQLELEKAMCYEAYQRLKLERDCTDRHDQGLLALELLTRHRDEIVPALQERHAFLVLDDLQSLPPVTVRLAVGIAGRGLEWGPPPLPPPLPSSPMTTATSSSAAGGREVLSAAAVSEGEWGGGGHVVDSMESDTFNGAAVSIQQQQQQLKARRKTKELRILATGDPVQVLGRLARDLPSWSSLHEHRRTTITTIHPTTYSIDTDSMLWSPVDGTLMRYDGLSLFRAAFPDAVVTHLPPSPTTPPTTPMAPPAVMLSSSADQSLVSTGARADGTAAGWEAETAAALLDPPSAPSQVDLTGSSSPVDATTPSTESTPFSPPLSPSPTATRTSVLYPGFDVEGEGTGRGFGVEAVWSVGLHNAGVHVGRALGRGGQVPSMADEALGTGKRIPGGDGGGGSVKGGRAVTPGTNAPAFGLTDHQGKDHLGVVRPDGLVEAWAFGDEMSALRGLAQAIKHDREANRRVLVVCCKTSSIWALQAALEEAGLEPRVTGSYSMHGGRGTGSPLHLPLSRVMTSLLTALSSPLDTHESATAIYDVLMHALGARSDSPQDAHVVSRLLERCRTRHEDFWTTIQKHDGTSDALKKFVSDFEELQTQAHTQPASHLVMQYLQRSGELSSREDSKGSKGKTKKKANKWKSLLTTTTTSTGSRRDHLSSYGDVTCGGDVEAADALAGFLHALVQIEEVAPDPRVSSVLPTLLLSRDYNDTSVIPSDDVDPASSPLLLCPWSRASVLEAPYDRIHITYATSTRLPSSRGYSSSSSSRIGGGGRLLLPPRIGLDVEPATVVGSAKDLGYDVDLRVLERLLARLPPSNSLRDNDSSSSPPGMVLSYSRRTSGGVREQRPTPLLGDLGMHVVMRSTRASGGSSTSSRRKVKGGVSVRQARVDQTEEFVVDVDQGERGSVSIRRAHVDTREGGGAKVDAQPPLLLSAVDSTASASAAAPSAPTSVEGKSSSSTSSPHPPSPFTDSLSPSLPPPPPPPSDPSAAPLRLSYSSIYIYRTCPLSYYYAHVLHLSPPTTESSVRMLYGRALHAAAHETMRYLQQEYVQHVLADGDGMDGGGRGRGERKRSRTTMPINRAKVLNLVQGKFREEWSKGTVLFNSRSHEESLLEEGLAAAAAIVDRFIAPSTDAEEGMPWRYPWWREGHGAAAAHPRVRVPALLERRFEVSIPLCTPPHHTHTDSASCIHPQDSVVLSGVLDRVDVVCPPGAPLALPQVLTPSPPPLPSSKFVMKRGRRDHTDHRSPHQQQHAHAQRGLDGESPRPLLSLQDNDDNAELWVVEYKSRVGAVRDVGALARGSFQLGLYGHAVERLMGKRPTKLFLESMEDGRVGEAGEGVYEEAREVLTAAAQGVAQRQFSAAPAFHKCRTCAFVSVCPHAATRSHAGAVPDTFA